LLNKQKLPCSSESATLLCLSSDIIFPLSIGREQDLSKEGTKEHQFDTEIFPISPAIDDDLINLFSSTFSPQVESLRVRSISFE